MKSVNVLLNSAEKIVSLCSILGQYEGPFDIVRGKHMIDAQSLIGMFCMDFTMPVRLDIHQENPEVMDRIEKFLV